MQSQQECVDIDLHKEGRKSRDTSVDCGRAWLPDLVYNSPIEHQFKA